MIHYLKSNKSSDELVNKLAKSWRTMKRQRRNTVNSKEKIPLISRTINILDQIDGQIIDLPALDNQTNTAACMVFFNGSVMCPSEMYKNLALWRMSQRSISIQIKKLQNKIKKLKVIHISLVSYFCSFVFVVNRIIKVLYNYLLKKKKKKLKNSLHFIQFIQFMFFSLGNTTSFR